MSIPELDTSIADPGAYANAVAHLGSLGVRLPTFSDLTDPSRIDAAITAALGGVHANEPHPLNLFRVHWHNDAHGDAIAVPDHVVLPEALTGVSAPIVVLLGDRFPMIGAHKVLAAYGCLAPRLVTGRFDPTRHRAVWPSTGNYCRGGVAISRIAGCRGVAVLPEGMSRERFEWLDAWVSGPEDVIRTPGTESNVKEIYDECRRLERDPDVVVFNQFRELGNYLVHYLATGRAVERVVETLADRLPTLRCRAFVSATGSAGTLGAGDWVKDRLGAAIVAVEALECPTLLYNGFGEHNIQGIGDKHVPFIHNVMNTDVVMAVSERATDAVDVLFNTDVGRRYLSSRHGVPDAVLASLGSFGLSAICNVIAAIKTARYLGCGPDDAIVTVATDGASLYETERRKTTARNYGGELDTTAAAETFGRYVLGAATDHVAELSSRDRDRIFNLGYFTWVEQQGVSVEDFVARRDPAFWRALHTLPARWDAMIDDLNRRSGAIAPGDL